VENDVEIDEVKNMWRESNRRLEASMRLNMVLLGQLNLRKTGTSLRWLSGGIAAELIVNAIGILLLGLFIAAHLQEPRFLVPAALLDAYAIALVIAGARQLAAIGGIDYDEPVVAIQRRLEMLRLQRIRTTLATLLFAPLMWVPFAIVALRALGVDLYAAGWSWLAANALFGVAFILVAIAVARRFGHRFARSARMRALADAIAGRTLASAIESLDSIARFEAS
jgi:hypothetical protein